MLKYASEFGKVTVGINSDEYLFRKYSGKSMPEASRVDVLRAIKYVQNVVVFQEDDPSELILKLKPEWYVKGNDYLYKWLPESEALEKVGCVLLITPWKDYSTSAILR